MRPAKIKRDTEINELYNPIFHDLIELMAKSRPRLPGMRGCFL
jgi:hypothetical protein